ncbi:MAG: ADP-ribosylglycohydrolase family protein [Desulfatiglandaceae bacterium]
MDEKKDRAVGAIMGALVGDALGVGPHWYYDLDQLRKDYGEWIDNYTRPKPGRYHAGLEAGENSQTGQVVTLLLESVAAHGGYDEADFTERLDSLLDSLDGTPQAGRYTDHAMRDVWQARKAQGLPWSEAGSLADTAEAAIRTSVLAAGYYNDFEKLVKYLASNVVLTHRDPFIAGQSVAFGLITAGLINGYNMGEVSKAIFKFAGEKGIDLVIEVPRQDRKEEVSFTDALLQPSWSYNAARDPGIRIEPAATACSLFGLACTLGFMLPAAYYYVSRFERHFYNAVMSALNGGGNNMARSALTGALSGAQAGLTRMPEYLIKGLSDHESLLEMAEKIIP